MKTPRFAGLLLAAIGLCAALPVFSQNPPEPVRLRLELDRPVLPADARETVVLKVALDGVRGERTRRAPVNLALVIDKSGSMSGEKIARARAAALEAVRRLSAEDIVSLVVYDNEVRTLVRAGRVGDGERITSAIEEIVAGGGTNLHGGVVAGAEELRKNIEGPYTHRVLLLSDGQANVGPRTPEALGSLGARLVREGISVTTIGLGLDYNEDLMTRLARRSDGNTYFVANSGDLPRIFEEELGDVLDVVARRLVVELEFPKGARPVRVVGREGRVEDRRAVIELNQLYGAQEKFALVEVEIDPAGQETARKVVAARVRYEDALTARSRELGGETTVRFTDDAREVISSANRRVQTDYVANRVAEAREKAVELADGGRFREAALVLRGVGDSFAAEARRFENAEMLDVVAPMTSEAAKVEAGGYGNRERKALRAKALQTYNQQRAD